MSMVIAHNMAALSSLNMLSGNTSALTKALKQTSSGQRINNAGDDSSGYAISEKMRAQVRGLDQDRVNVQNGVSLCKVALGGLDNIKESVARMHDLAMQSTNDTMTDFDRQILQKEVDQLKDNIEDIVYGTTFNGIHPLYPTDGIGSETPVTAKADIVFIIDTTGSMKDPIINVAKNVKAFAARLEAEGIDCRFGVVDYRDRDELHFVMKYDFMTDVKKLAERLDSCGSWADGGGDDKEGGLDAIMDKDNGALSYKFRDDAAKQFIVITDEGVHYKDDGSGKAYKYTIDDTNAALKAADVKLTYVTEATGASDWEKIAEGTGGLGIVVPSLATSDFGKHLASFANSITGETTTDGGKSGHLYIQEGTRANQTVTLRVYDNRLKALGLKTIRVDTRDEAQLAMQCLDMALEKVLDHATSWGASASRLDYCAENIITAHESTTNAESVLRDADMAKSMTDYTKYNVLAQAAQSMLAQANQNSSNVLSLLQ